MKVGDTVMFTDEASRYIKWFYGKIGVVEQTSTNLNPAPMCRVRWITPVPYFDNRAAYSDFPANSFTVLVNNA